MSLKGRFADLFGGGDDPRVFFSPGRVNLIGEHTDYNGGYVFPCALTFGTYGVARERSDGVIRLASVNFDTRVEVSADDLRYDKAHGWANNPKGVAVEFTKLPGHPKIPGFDLLIHGNIPSASGLSSSASVCVLVATILNAFTGAGLSGIETALLAQRVEHNYIGVNCGIMDQFAVAMGKAGHAILLKCDTLKYEYVPVDMPGYKIVIANTKKPRALTDSKYNERVYECQAALSYLKNRLPIQSLCDVNPRDFELYKHLIPSPAQRSRAEHVIYENERAFMSVDALREGRLDEFGKLMIASHNSLRDLYEVTGPELDALVEESLAAPGVIGARMTGAGMGGCSVAIVAEDAVNGFIRRVGEGYERRVGHPTEFYIADIADGAGEALPE